MGPILNSLPYWVIPIAGFFLCSHPQRVNPSRFKKLGRRHDHQLVLRWFIFLKSPKRILYSKKRPRSIPKVTSWQCLSQNASNWRYELVFIGEKQNYHSPSQINCQLVIWCHVKGDCVLGNFSEYSSKWAYGKNSKMPIWKMSKFVKSKRKSDVWGRHGSMRFQ